ncbi:hypothetical protein ES705_25225 [subsurface metagenome]
MPCEIVRFDRVKRQNITLFTSRTALWATAVRFINVEKVGVELLGNLLGSGDKLLGLAEQGPPDLRNLQT